MFNLVLALLASLGIVLLLVLVVVRPDRPPRADVDYVATAAQAQPAVSEPLYAPSLPPGWTSNNATLDTAPGESFVWKVGLITPAQQYIALEQGIGTGPSWLGGRLGRLAATSTTDIGGVTWDVYDRRDSNDPGNFAYSLVGRIGGQRTALARHRVRRRLRHPGLCVNRRRRIHRGRPARGSPLTEEGP